MNFFFLIENKKIKSKLKIPLFQNSGYFNKNIILFSAKIFNSEWKYEELKIEKFQNFYFIDSNTFSDEEIFFLAETKDFDKSLSINNELFNFNNFTNTSPSFRSNLTINFEKNIDILNYVSNHNSMRPKLVIGFAAETNDLDQNAISKLTNKNCDWIIANDVSKKDIGFNSNFNEVTIHYKDSKIKKEKLSLKKKSEISEEIVDRIVTQIN